MVHKGEYNEYFNDLKQIAELPDTMTKIKYVCNVSPYYYFQMTDPDGNVIEVTGAYTPEEGKFGEEV